MHKRRLLLVGGGHAHLFVLEALRKTRPAWSAGLDVVMVSSSLHLAYSGMLPGLIAGHYRPSECHIDLARLAAAAGVTLRHGTVEELDLSNGMVRFNGDALPREPEGSGGERSNAIAFDILSLDMGGTAAFAATPGAAAHGIGLKPTESFLQRWRALQERITHAQRPLHVVTVGGGPGGVEVALAMARRMAPHKQKVKWSLVTRDRLLPGYPRRAARLLDRKLADAGIAVRMNSQVASVETEQLLFRDGSSAAFDALLWAAGVAPQEWVARSGLACVDGGFVHINEQLQSVSHPHVFAAGDAATDPDHRRPKAGVFAVRQGAVLASNLLCFALGDPLTPYRPQRGYLSLISCGGRHAVAAWHGLSWEGEWVWRWKDRIDRRFVDRFSASS